MLDHLWNLLWSERQILVYRFSIYRAVFRAYIYVLWGCLYRALFRVYICALEALADERLPFLMKSFTGGFGIEPYEFIGLVIISSKTIQKHKVLWSSCSKTLCVYMVFEIMIAKPMKPYGFRSSWNSLYAIGCEHQAANHTVEGLIIAGKKHMNS